MNLNDYDAYEAEMLEAGWSLDKIEQMWQKHEVRPLEDDEKVQNEADYHQGYLNGWDDGRTYREGNQLHTPRWSQEKIEPDDVRKHYAQGYVNGYGDGREGLSCNPAGEIEEGWDFPLPPIEDEF